MADFNTVALDHVVWGKVERPSDDSSSSIYSPTNHLREVAFQQNSSSSSDLHRAMIEATSAASGQGPSPRCLGPGARGPGAASSTAWAPQASSPAPLAAGGGGVPPFDSVLEQLLSKQDLWSKGSAGHRYQKCKPCHYVHAAQGCKNGLQCEFCHLPHTEARSGKPSKLCMSKRLHCKQVALALDAIHATHPEVYKEASKLVSSDSLYLQNILQARMQEAATAQPEVAVVRRRPNIQSL